MAYVKIPSSFKVGGAEMEVRKVVRCDENKLGTSFVAGGYIEIADICNKDDVQSDGCKRNTFFHELTHAILDTMGESELSQNEKFVCTFSSFLTEAMGNAFFKENVPELDNKGIRWRRIHEGERLPCASYIWEITFNDNAPYWEGKLIPNAAGVKMGRDTWYLPVDDIVNLEKED